MFRKRSLILGFAFMAAAALTITPHGAEAKKKKKENRVPATEHCADGGIKIDRPGPQSFRCFEHEVVSGICVKAGTETWGVGAGGEDPGCYEFSELGSATGSVSGGGTGRDCKDISYTTYYCEPGETPEPICGDGIIEGEEQCDPPGRVSENLACNEACRLVEVPGPEEPVCGNGIVEAGETCDPPGLISETLGCTEACQIRELPGPGEPVCGNGIVETGETCDPPGLISETLGCTEACQLRELPGGGGEGGEGGTEQPL